MVAFYNEQDQEIYDNVSKFMPQSKYLRSAPTFTAPMTEEEKITETFGIPYTNAFTNSGQGGRQGGGKFGNQDMSDMKEFNMPGFDNPVKGFRNVNTGMYQDKDGLNIQNLGIKAQPFFAKVLNAIGFDMDDDDDPTYPGYFTNNSLGSIFKSPGSFKQYYDRQDKKKQDDIQKKIKELKVSGSNSPDNYGIQGLQKSGNYGGNDTYSGQGSTVSSSGDVKDSSGNVTGNINDEFAKGGRAGYFFGGRARLQGGGMSQGNQSNIDQSTNIGGGAVGDHSTMEQNMNHREAMRNNQRKQPSILNNTIDTASELNYLNNLKNFNLPGLALGFGFNKIRNYLGNKKEEDDKFSALPTNNYTAKLVGPALAQMRTLEKAKGMEQFDGPFSTEQQKGLNKLQQMDQEKTIYSQPIFVGANGGRAMFKDGGLASIL